MSARTPDRRQLLKMVFALGVIGTIGPGIRIPVISRSQAAARLVDAFAPADGYELIAAEYAATAGDVTQVTLLEALLDVQLQRALEGANAVVRMRELLFDRIWNDHAYGRVVLLRGWVLSETECQLCALAAQLKDSLLLGADRTPRPGSTRDVD